jgi:6-phosphogluconolactonase (cycloisomerase 2 family)
MATKPICPAPSLVVCRRNPFQRSNALVVPSLLILALLTAAVASAQTPQQYVYSSSSASSTVNGSAKNALAGTLAPLSGSPFPARSNGGPMAIDPQGRFLFIVNPAASTISMFQIDSNSGALTEVPASPFKIGPTLTPTPPTNPQSLATEASGKFLYVGYEFGSAQGTGEIDQFMIDAANQQLVPVTGTTAESFVRTTSGPVAMASAPKGRTLYAYLGFLTSAGSSNAELDAYSIDPASGNLTPLNTENDVEQARCMALDPQDRFLYSGHGSLEGLFGGYLISPVDGSFSGVIPTLSLGQNEFPSFLVVETSGQYLYVGTTMAIHIFSINSSSGALTEVQNSPFPANLATASVADPVGPFLYTADATGVHGFQIDLQTGLLNELPGSPFPGSGATLAISGAPVQAVSGPVATLFPGSLSFGNVLQNTTSSAQIIQIVSNGDQALSISAIGFSGDNPADFTQTNTCQPPTVLNPAKSCSVSITFTPTAAGPRQAFLTVTDNAPGSPQSAALTGTGLTPTSAVTLMPGSLNFPLTTQGSSSPSQNITLTSSGNAPVNISSITVAGANPGDFLETNTCQMPTTLNPGSSCSVSVTFAPTAAGTRQAMLLVTDNAPGSPQSAALTGTGQTSTSGVTLLPANLSFPAITQGTSSGQMSVTVTNNGGAPLHITSVVAGGNNPSEFSNQPGSCTGAIASQASCTISVTFAPLTTGQRSETISINDDAPNSPQTINVTGTANPAFLVTPAPSSSMSATVTAGQTAQYNLQITPGSSYSGTISMTCTGAPTGASCQVSPSMVSVSGGTAAPFMVLVTTSGAAGTLPFSNAPDTRRRPPPPQWPLLVLFLVLFAKLVTDAKRASILPKRWPAFSGALSLIVVLAVLAVAGCGGGSANIVPAPPTIVTPQGTTMLIVTPSATSSSGQPLQLPQIQLTLTVK